MHLYHGTKSSLCLPLFQRERFSPRFSRLLWDRLIDLIPADPRNPCIYTSCLASRRAVSRPGTRLKTLLFNIYKLIIYLNMYNRLIDGSNIKYYQHKKKLTISLLSKVKSPFEGGKINSIIEDRVWRKYPCHHKIFFLHITKFSS